MKQATHLIVLAAALMSASTLAGCSTAAPASADGLKRVVGTDLIGTRGLTTKDNRNIGRTVASLCAAKIWTTEQCRQHDAAIKAEIN